jgi:hypothetical protein
MDVNWCVQVLEQFRVKALDARLGVRNAVRAKVKAMTKRGPTDALELKISVRSGKKNSPHTRINDSPRNHLQHNPGAKTALTTRTRQRAETVRAKSAKPQSWVSSLLCANCRRHSSRLFCPALYRDQNKRTMADNILRSAQEEGTTENVPGRLPRRPMYAPPTCP